MRTLVLGGTRSGKSAVAERLAGADEPVTYLATATVEPGDADHLSRIEGHRARRPRAWTTLECPRGADLLDALRTIRGPVLVDSLGTWLVSYPEMHPDTSGLVAALEARAAPTVLVSEEVGLSVHASTDVGRRYVDAMGSLNQAVARVSDRVLLVVAGRSIELPAGTA